MRWKVHSEHSLYTDQWLDVRTSDVELPDGRHLDHRLIRMTPSAGTVVLDDTDRVLMMWRHRFITDMWAWEIPIGRVNENEAPIDAAARETEEETGWRPQNLQPLVYSQPSSGILDSAHNLFKAETATYIGPPADGFESDRIEWVPLASVKELINKKEIVGGPTMIGVLYLLSDR